MAHTTLELWRTKINKLFKPYKARDEKQTKVYLEIWSFLAISVAKKSTMIEIAYFLQQAERTYTRHMEPSEITAVCCYPDNGTFWCSALNLLTTIWVVLRKNNGCAFKDSDELSWEVEYNSAFQTVADRHLQYWVPQYNTSIIVYTF